MSDSKKDKGYLGTLGAAAPAFAAKSVLGDLPRGAIEYAVEHKIRDPKQSTLKLLRQGSRGRGAGRAAGGIAGILTAPLYLSSVGMLASDDKSEKAKGLALNLGSTAGYAALKGGLEGGIEARAAGKNLLDALRSGAGTGLARVPVKLMPAALTASAIAKGRKKSKKNDSSLDKYVLPVAVGAGTGATSRMAEKTLRSLATGKAPGLRPLLALGAGGAVGGALGAAVLSKVTDAVLSKEGAAEELGRAKVAVNLATLHRAGTRAFRGKVIPHSPAGYDEVRRAVRNAPGLENAVTRKVLGVPLPKRLVGMQEKLIDNRISHPAAAGVMSSLAATLPTTRRQAVHMGVSAANEAMRGAHARVSSIPSTNPLAGLAGMAIAPYSGLRGAVGYSLQDAGARARRGLRNLTSPWPTRHTPPKIAPRKPGVVEGLPTPAVQSKRRFAINPASLKDEHLDLVRASGFRGAPTRAGRRGFVSATKLHEAREARELSRARGTYPGFEGHHGVAPPLQDLNIATTLRDRTNPGAAAETAAALRQLRQDEMQALTRQLPGLRRLRLGEEGQQRLSRHAIRRIEEARRRNIDRYGPFKTSLASAEKKRTAVIIKGNPKYLGGKNKQVANQFYDQMAQELRGAGYEVSFDPGKPHTAPRKADLWVGHSRGVSRLRFAPKGTRTVGVGTANFEGAVNHPGDNTAKPGVGGAKGMRPNHQHFQFTPEMLAVFRKKIATKEEPKPRYAPTLKEWFQPYPHQKRAIERAYANGGRMILAHQTGLGKTAAGIAMRERLAADGHSRGALVVVPSGLRHNFAEDGIDKFTEGVRYQIIGSKEEARRDKKVVYLGQEKHVAQGGPQYTIVSYNLFRRDPIGLMQRTGANTLIFDEFHTTRNEKARTFKAALQARPFAQSFIGLTASPINNSLGEIATLLTISEGRRDMSPKQMERAFLKTVGYEKGFRGGKKKIQELTNEEHLVQYLYPKMDVVTTDSVRKGEMPRKNIEEVKVPMSEEQYKLYQLALDEVGALEEYLLRRDPNISVRDAEALFAQLSEARRVSNAVHLGRKDVTLQQSAERTPKVKRLLDDLEAELAESPDNKVVVYSNLVRGGVDVLSAGLKARGIDHGIFTGKGTVIGDQKIDSQARQQAVRDYKAGKKRVIVVSGAGAEGLDLKNSTAFMSLDGHFNPERITQAEARAVRLGGQQFRDPEERQVDVRRYMNTVPESARPGFFGKLIGSEAPMTTDEWMYAVAKRKQKKSEGVIKAVSKPHKYIRKYKDHKGEWRYVYPEDDKNPSQSATIDTVKPRNKSDVSAPIYVSQGNNSGRPWWNFWDGWFGKKASVESVLRQGAAAAGRGAAKLKDRALSMYLGVSPEFLAKHKTELGALVAQGVPHREAVAQVLRFNKGHADDYAFHFTRPEFAKSILRSGHLKATQAGLAGRGVYAGTTPTPGFVQKHVAPVGWGLPGGFSARVPIKKDRAASRRAFVPRWTTVFGKGEEVHLRQGTPVGKALDRVLGSGLYT